MLSSEILLEKKTWKKLLNSVSFEIFLPFSMRLFFSPFKDHFVERGIIVFQNVLLFVTFYILITVVDFFVVISTFFTKISLKFEVLVISFSSVLQKICSQSRPFHKCSVKLFNHKRCFFSANILFLIGACLLNILQTVSLKVLKLV